jgi:FKBP-type peptidyl-prolyl cis-trans isomerase
MKANWKIVLSLLVVVLVAGSCIDNDLDEQTKLLQQEIQEIDAYLTSIGQGDKVLIDNSTGIRILISNYGIGGIQPANTTKIKVTRNGRLFKDSSVTFDTGTITDELQDIIPVGLQRSLGAMQEGFSATVYLPSNLGYGASGKGNVPANSILVYSYTFDKVIRTDDELVQAKKDSAAIKKYLDDNQISATYHPTGLYYKIVEGGSGTTPTIYNPVSFDYKLWKLTDGVGGTPVDQGSLSNQNLLGNLIQGFKIGIPRIPEGTTVMFYIPSGLAYGPNAQRGLPANANLIFEVKLTQVVK